jgi:hypothetical protein
MGVLLGLTLGEEHKLSGRVRFCWEMLKVFSSLRKQVARFSEADNVMVPQTFVKYGIWFGEATTSVSNTVVIGQQFLTWRQCKNLFMPNKCNVANVHHAWLDECTVHVMQKNFKLSFDGRDSGSKKCKRDYGGDCDGVLWSLLVLVEGKQSWLLQR